MMFPGNGGGRPYVRIDGRSGAFSLSTQDGDPEIVEMKGMALILDLVTARQGWLKLSTDGADWVPLAAPDAWATTPRPSSDHAPAVEIYVFCKSWPEPRVRQLRASSKCVTSFIARVCAVAGDLPEDRAVAIAITGARVIKIGKGTSAEIQFEIAPRAKWPPRAFFDEVQDVAPAEESKPAPVKPEPTATNFDDLEDPFS